MAKIVRHCYENHKAQLPKLSISIGLNRHNIIITFKMFKVDFKFWLTKKG